MTHNERGAGALINESTLGTALKTNNIMGETRGMKKEISYFVHWYNLAEVDPFQGALRGVTPTSSSNKTAQTQRNAYLSLNWRAEFHFRSGF